MKHDEIEVVREEEMINFTNKVEEFVKKFDMTYIEAITQVCEECGLDEDNVLNLIAPSLLESLYSEARKLRLIKTTGVSLPI